MDRFWLCKKPLEGSDPPCRDYRDSRDLGGPTVDSQVLVATTALDFMLVVGLWAKQWPYPRQDKAWGLNVDQLEGLIAWILN